jgi:hypothetical protein
MAKGREEAVERIVADIKKLDYDQLLRLVEKWAPETGASPGDRHTDMEVCRRMKRSFTYRSSA